jgi:hypothetical protein
MHREIEFREQIPMNSQTVGDAAASTTPRLDPGLGTPP